MEDDTMMTYEQRFDMVVTHAWETWTKNGLNLDDDMRVQTTKSVQDAAANVYTKSMDDVEWVQATVRRLKYGV
jgi:hypothetical protein